MRMLIRYGKEARLRFISHLDLQRFLHMALNRSGLPIRYSQGFNPHPIMAFGSALGLYQTSEYELLDIALSAPMGRKRCEDSMRAALPVDMPIYEVRLVDDRYPTIMSRVYAADYSIRAYGDNAKALTDAIPAFMDRETVPAVKKTKSGEKEIDIRPLVLKMSAESSDTIRVCLMSTEKETLKPSLMLEKLSETAGIEVPETLIRRLCLYGQDEEGTLVPMMQL